MIELTQTPPQSASPYSPAGDQLAEMPENSPRLGTPIPGTTGGLPSLSGLSVTQNPMADEFITTPPQPQHQTNDVNPNTMSNQAAPNAHPYPAPPQFAGGGAVQKAEQVRQMGRGEDKVLMHVTPHELQGLQALALAHGGSLTINPHTGLPEAGFLGKIFKKLLPTLVGFGLNFVPGVGPLAAAGLTALGSTAATGSLKKGLMAGLQAYGGASLAGAVAPSATGTIAKAAAAPLATSGGANAGITAAENTFFTGLGGTGVPAVGSTAGLASAAPSITGAEAKFLTKAGGQFVPQAAKTGLAALPGRFATAARAGLPGGTPGFVTKAAPMLAGMGLMQGVSGALSAGASRDPGTGAIDNSYQGPYYAQDRQQIMYDEAEPTSRQRRHFAVSMPEIRNTMGQVVAPGSMTPQGTPILRQVARAKPKKGEPMYDFQMVPFMGGPAPMLNEQDMGYAGGGEVELSNGAFVLDARTVSELGNGSSNAGKDLLRRIGGKAVEGPGDGVSDSIPARIDRNQPARVARDEVIIPAEAVKRIGKGNEKKGADKLYALMNKAHNARKAAKRGQDTKLRRGLAL